jgi:hypothetical protein
MSFIPALIPMALMYYTLYIVLRSHRIGLREIISWNALIIYSMLIISYCYLRMPIPSVFIATIIFTIKILQKNPLLMFPSNTSYKLQLLFMAYLLFTIINSLLMQTLYLLDNILRIILSLK